MDLVLEILASEAFIGGVVAILGPWLAVIINRGAKAFTARTRIQVEAKAKADLHDAVLTGVESALRLGLRPASAAFLAHVRAHLRESIPEALAVLIPGDSVIERLVLRFTRQALALPAADPK